MISSKNFSKPETDPYEEGSTSVSDTSSYTQPITNSSIPDQQELPIPKPPPQISVGAIVSDAKQCIVCETKLGGMFKSKKFNCSVCGSAVCAKHSAMRDETRICDICTRNEY